MTIAITRPWWGILLAVIFVVYIAVSIFIGMKADSFWMGFAWPLWLLAALLGANVQ